MTRWWLGLSVRAQTVLKLIVLLPFGFSVPAAIDGAPYTARGAIEGVIAALVGLFFLYRSRNPVSWELEPDARRQLNMVQYRGEPGPDDDINAIAADRLRRRARTERVDRFAVPAYLLLTAMFPVVAAVRVDARWSFAALPNVLAFAVWLIVRPQSPSIRLARIEAALDTQPDVSG